VKVKVKTAKIGHAHQRLIKKSIKAFEKQITTVGDAEIRVVYPEIKYEFASG